MVGALIGSFTVGFIETGIIACRSGRFLHPVCFWDSVDYLFVRFPTPKAITNPQLFTPLPRLPLPKSIFRLLRPLSVLVATVSLPELNCGKGNDGTFHSGCIETAAYLTV